MNREVQLRHFLIELFRQEVQISLAGLGFLPTPEQIVLCWHLVREVRNCCCEKSPSEDAVSVLASTSRALRLESINETRHELDSVMLCKTGALVRHG